MGPSPALNFEDGEWRGLLWQDRCQPAHEWCRLLAAVPHTWGLQWVHHNTRVRAVLGEVSSPKLLDNLDVPEVHVGGRLWVNHLHDSVHGDGGQLGGVLGHNLQEEGHTIPTWSQLSHDSSRTACWCCPAPTFELREVLALCNKASRSERSTEIDMPRSTSTDLSAARWKASEMVVGCRPAATQTATYGSTDVALPSTAQGPHGTPPC